MIPEKGLDGGALAHRLSIREWPDGERPREKLRARGVAALSDAELLAIFLPTRERGKSALDLAQELLSEHGGLRSLLGADEAAFTRTSGLGPAKFS